MKHKRTAKTLPPWLKHVDAASGHCANIAAVAGLMEACRGEPVEADVVVNAGWMISRELWALRTELMALAKEAKR